MLTKVYSLLSRSDSAKDEDDVERDEFQAFYINLTSRIIILESQLVQESHFTLEWILSTVEFARWAHSNAYMLLEAVWLPMRKTMGMEVAETYLSVSLKLLGICNGVRDVTNELEYFQMSLVHGVETLGALVDNLAACKEDNFDLATSKTQLESCRLELDKLKTLERSASREDKSFESSGPSDTCSKTHPEWTSVLLERSKSFRSPRSNSKKADLVVQALKDVHIVITVISSLLVWLLTKSSEGLFICPEVGESSVSLATSDSWSAALLRLTKRVGASTSRDEAFALAIKSIRSNYLAIYDLLERVEAEVSRRHEADREDRFSELVGAVAHRRGILLETRMTLERLSIVLQETFSEVLQRREELMKTIENQLMRSHTTAW